MSSSLSYQSLQNRASAWACLSGCTDDVSASSNLQIPAMNDQQRSLSQLHQSRDETEELLMSEFNKLSVDDQAKALNDIYSAASELKENPVMIDKLLTEFEQQVEQGNYPIYELALNQDRSYVEDPSFRLKFLRANLHDVNMAVKQMISFLYQKAKYFGADKVARDITLDDLTPNDLKLMLSGYYHIQDGTDRHGRVIFYIHSYHPPEDDMDSVVRDCIDACRMQRLVPMQEIFEYTHYYSINPVHIDVATDKSFLLHIVQHIDPNTLGANERVSFDSLSCNNAWR